jgi:adenylate cyclase
MPVATERRLVAIFAADVEGYSRLMGVDEVGTLRDLMERRTILDGLIASHRGRIANTAGDSVLAEFGSAVDAVQCAVEAQTSLSSVNAELPPDRHINFRIGVHVGDVMVKGGDLFGDGVNIAARLQSLASAGGVCISGAAHDQVRKILPFLFTYLGAQQVKNLEEPVPAYIVSAADASVGNLAGSSGASTINKKPLLLPDKPSIAVLPFQNMSGDPEQDYFIDGMVEDIITALSRIGGLFVIARNSSFTYKGRAADVREVGRELGVRYVLEGSVRRLAARVRVTCQLIEAATGAHVWAERFEGDSVDIFELQDKITESVAGIIEPNIRRAEIARARAKPTESLDARDLYLRALANFYLLTRESLEEAGTQLHRALDIDPSYALARAHLARIYQIRNLHGWGKPGDQATALTLARNAIGSDDNDPETLRTAGHVLGSFGDHDRALAAVKRAVTLNPNSAPVLFSTAWVHCYACDPEPALVYFNRAIRLSPSDPAAEDLLGGLGFAHLVAGRFSEAQAILSRAVKEVPDYGPTYRHLIVALVQLGRVEEASSMVVQLLRANPEYRNSTHLKMWRDQQFVNRYADALRLAGVPE